MKTHHIEMAAISGLMLVAMLAVWLGIAGPLIESLAKANSGEWLGFAGGAIGGIATLIAAITAWLAVQRQITAERSAREASRSREAHGLALLLYPVLLELKGRLERSNAENHHVHIPSDLIDTFGRLHILGKPGDHILYMIGVLRLHNAIPEYPVTTTDDQIKHAQLKLTRRVIAIDHCADAVEGLRGLIDFRLTHAPC